MPESELAKEVTKVIKRADKLVNDFRKNTFELLRSLKQLRERFSEKEDKNEEESETK